MAKDKSDLGKSGDDELAVLIAVSANEADKVWEALPQVDQDLLRACDTGSAREVEELLSVGADPNVKAAHGTALTISIRSEVACTEKIKHLIAANADVELPEPPDVTPLVVAASNNKPELILLLSASGADVNRKGETQGWTALMTAASLGTLGAAVALLAHGADLSLKSNFGLTVFDIAKANGQNEILRFFLHHMRQASKPAGLRKH